MTEGVMSFVYTCNALDEPTSEKVLLDGPRP